MFRWGFDFCTIFWGGYNIRTLMTTHLVGWFLGGGYFVRRQVAVDRILCFPTMYSTLLNFVPRVRVHAVKERRDGVQVTCPLYIPYVLRGGSVCRFKRGVIEGLMREKSPAINSLGSTEIMMRRDKKLGKGREKRYICRTK